MAVTGTKTALDIINFAAQKAGITGFGETADADVASHALTELNQMLKGWQNQGYMLWAKASATLYLTTGAEHELDPVRPLRILSARYCASGTSAEIPMLQLTRDEYDRMPKKDRTGTPTQFYYDRQREAARLYVWPVLASATGQRIDYTYERELDDLTSTTQIVDLPGEWWDATCYNLAARMMESLPVQRANQIVPQRAQMLLNSAMAFDREGSVFFCMGDD